MVPRQSKNGSAEINLSPGPWIRTISRIMLWIADGHWPAVVLVILALIGFQIWNFSRQRIDAIQILEFFIIISLLLIIGLLILSLSQGIQNQARIIRILDVKHKLSLDFSRLQDWGALVEHIASVPASLASVSRAWLFLSNVITNQFELASSWSRDGEAWADLGSEAICHECVEDENNRGSSFRQCKSEYGTGEASSQAAQYCLFLKDNENLLGILQFTLEPGATLSQEQLDIFRNIGMDIAMALKAGLDRKVLAALNTSETALAERRSVSHYLHDHLGQSLGFLHLKMDQLLTQKKQLSLEKVLADLELMRDATYESYQIVRGVLSTMQPETTLTLTNLLADYASKISARANIDIDFKTKGTPVILPDEVHKAIFYAFEESLSNVEKHARATRVKILAAWNPDHFALTISDNGIGFVPQSINTDQHFGLEILNERMASIKGRITLNTSENSGTLINIFVPMVRTDIQERAHE